MERRKYKIESLERGEREPYVTLSFGLGGVGIDSSRIDNSNLRNILPGRSVIVESELNHVVALYAPGDITPFYTSKYQAISGQGPMKRRGRVPFPPQD